MPFKVTQRVVVCLPMNRQLPSNTIWAFKPAESITHLWSGSTHGLAMKNIPDGPQGGQIKVPCLVSTDTSQAVRQS